MFVCRNYRIFGVFALKMISNTNQIVDQFSVTQLKCVSFALIVKHLVLIFIFFFIQPHKFSEGQKLFCNQDKKTWDTKKTTLSSSSTLLICAELHVICSWNTESLLWKLTVRRCFIRRVHWWKLLCFPSAFIWKSWITFSSGAELIYMESSWWWPLTFWLINNDTNTEERKYINILFISCKTFLLWQLSTLWSEFRFKCILLM